MSPESKSIEIEINGQRRKVSFGLTISALVEQLEMNPNIVAVELNGDLIPRENHSTTPVHSGDQLEVVSLFGGG